MTSDQRLPVVLVTGLSGGGKASILRALEDVGFEAVDNPPLTMLEEMVARGDRKLAIGVDARTRGFDATLALEALDRLRRNPALRPELVFAWASDSTLLRRYTETRRRHPMAPQGRVIDGIEAEKVLTAALRDRADLVIDTSDLPLAGLRQLIEKHFGDDADPGRSRLVVSLISFAYRQGLPPEADLVFDGRFLRNPHYDPDLRPRTGLDPAVGAYIEADPDYTNYFARITDLVDLVLPRFVQEGKKYATIAIGCTGGQHRSVYLIEQLAAHLSTRPAEERPSGNGAGWRLTVTHRELVREGHGMTLRPNNPVPRREPERNGEAARSSPVQAQEA
jgi:UPF0042 nucleotide-binding protein